MVRKRGIRLHYWCVAVPKSDKQAVECEDEFGVNLNRFAISDGSTESVGSKAWAKLLVGSYIAGRDPFSTETIESNIKAWNERMASYVHSSSDWFFKEKVKKGSSATFLGLTIRPSLGWAATAIGDSCLFQFRSTKMILSWPLTHLGQFDKTPPLFKTNKPPNKQIVREGDFKNEDRFLLATDALAKWMLGAYLGGYVSDILTLFINANSPARMQDAVLRLRSGNHPIPLEDDDATVITIRIEMI